MMDLPGGPSGPARGFTRGSPGSGVRVPIRPRGRLLRLVGMVFALVALCAVSASPALAERARVFEAAFGCAEGSPGCTTPDLYPLAADPWSVAVNDSTGDVYVTDQPNHRVEEFTASGRVRVDVR